MKKAIVIGYGVSSLGVIRSLGLERFQIIACYYDKTDFSHVSKFVYERVKVPHPREEEDRFIEVLLKNSGKWSGALIFDTDDNVTVSISKNKHKLTRYYKIGIPDWDTIRKFIHKQETYKLAHINKIPYPRTLSPTTLDDLREIKDKVEYPCILKPSISHEFRSKFRSKNLIVHNYNELISKFNICLEAGQDVMVQEIIPGPSSKLYNLTVYINSRGYVNARFLRIKIRQDPPQFGITRVGISISRIFELERFTDILLKEAGFKGIATAEYKKDPRDNQFKLLEVNPRTTRSNWHATYCGVNFPWIIYKDLVDGIQITSNGYKKDIYWIDLSADIYNSIFGFNGERNRLRDYLKPYLSKNKTFAVLSSRDIKPFLRQVLMLPIRRYRSFKFTYGKRL
jgi:D-aspartate ligase